MLDIEIDQDKKKVQASGCLYTIALLHIITCIYIVISNFSGLEIFTMTQGLQ